MNAVVIVLVILVVLLILIILGLFAWLMFKNKTNSFTQINNVNPQEQIKLLSDQLNSINQTMNEISNVKSNVEDLVDIFKNNKQRGTAAEYSLQTILQDQFGNSQVLEKEHKLQSGGKIDFHIKVNNSKGIGIDSKFPLDSFRSFLNSGSNKSFLTETKKMIKELHDKYIETGDLDALIMYLPSEHMFQELCNKDDYEQVFTLAIKQSIYICSPSTLNIMIFFLFKSIQDYNLSKNIKDVIKVILDIQDNFDKWTTRYQNLEKSINNLVSDKCQLDISTNKIKKGLTNINKIINDEEK